MRDGIDDVWGPRTPYYGQEAWPERVDENVSATPERWVQSACVLCSNGCAADIGVRDGRVVGMRGRAVDRINRGRLGPKGLNGWVANNSADRLTRPRIRRDGRLRDASWDEAMSLIVERTKAIRAESTAGAIGFYTSGQLFLEEYYALAVIGRAGLGTPHMDGNTRLCTATASQALKETFGCDGQPGSYADIDVTDALLLVGHNVAASQTVLWSRILDRRRGPKPPKLIVVDPRATPVAAEADVHLAPRLGTNVAVLNGLLALMIEAGHVDQAFLDARTVGYGHLRDTVRPYTPARVAHLSGVPEADLRRAATILGTTPSLVSTCLQGVYQSNQATGAAVQVNNINLLRGFIGLPGSGVLQMNGQPTAQNTRETGAVEDLPAFRNWQNPRHVAELAALWNVEPAAIPHWGPATPASRIFQLCETGAIRMLWIQCTNPAVSMPDLHRVRAILADPSLFLVVQDAFPTETTEHADVVLPAAIWAEKTGCFTNADRTVHISHKAVEPPGEARPDLDIFLDFARRMDFRDKDGAPLIKWREPEEVFDAWRACSRGRPCDYSGLSYAKLSEGSGLQWPCDARAPGGTDRLYTDHVFPTTLETCEDFGHDLETGGDWTAERFKALGANGRAILKAVDYKPSGENPGEDYPFVLNTGRVTDQFHTRTKTGRSPKLNAAAPDVFAQIAPEDARRLAVAEGDRLRVTSRRGTIVAPARIGGIAPGEVFVPFHYGSPDKQGHARAANELTAWEIDPASKQPRLKQAAVRLEKDGPVAAAAPAGDAGPTAAVPDTAPPAAKRTHVADALNALIGSLDRLAQGFQALRERYVAEPDVEANALLFKTWSQEVRGTLQAFVATYGEQRDGGAANPQPALLRSPPGHATDLLRDLQDLWLATKQGLIFTIALSQAAQALRDEAFGAALAKSQTYAEREGDWLLTRIKQTAPQSLTVPS